MALTHADMVRETSTTTGTGTYSLAGAATGFRTFVAGVGTGNTCYYSATDGTDWEIGLGTVTDATPDTLSRDTVLASSNAGAAVNWGAGTRTLRLTYPAGKAVTTDSTASDSAAGLIEIAIQSEMETASDTARAVVPGRQHFHPGHPKCWAYVTVSAGTPTLQTSYNVTSITDSGTGLLTITIDTDFSSANWAPLMSVNTSNQSGGADDSMEAGDFDSVAAGSVILQCLALDVSAGDMSGVDPAAYAFAGFGDHA
jgi:hypothetical protein